MDRYSCLSTSEHLLVDDSFLLTFWNTIISIDPEINLKTASSATIWTGICTASKHHSHVRHNHHDLSGTVLLYKTWRLPIIKDRNNNIMQNSIPICDSPGVRENPTPRYWRDEQISQGLLSVVSVNADYKFITLAGRLWLDTKESAFRLFCQWDRTGKKKLGLRFLQTFDKKRCLAYNCVETSGFRVKAKYKVTVCDENHYFFLYNWNGLVFSRFRQQKLQWRMKRKKKKNVTMWSKCMVWGSTPHLHNWFFLLWM